MKSFSLLILIALAAISHPALLDAQAPDGRGSSGETISTEDQRVSHTISGTLLDPSGAAIAKAQVSLLGPDAQPLTQVTTDNSGTFRFDNVAAGSYTLEFHAEGFRDARVSTSLTAKRQASLRVVLQIAVPNESVTVATGGSVPVVSTDTAENQNANTIDRNALDQVPVFDQDYITTMSRFLDDNATGTNGVTLVVNGIEANGPGVTPSAVAAAIWGEPAALALGRQGRP